MAGQLHGEVLSYARRLYRAGVSRNAIDALSVVAEACRVESRRGEVFRGRVADKLCATERTATRAMAELLGHGLVRVVQRAGGRGRTGRGTVYEMVSLPGWLADPADPTLDGPGCPADPDPGDTPVSRRSDPDHRSAGHDGCAPIAPPACGQPDPRDIPGPSAGHPGVAPPVGPVTTPGGTTEVTTGPRAIPTPPPDAPRSANHHGHDGGSLCGQLDCRAPAPCGACGRARRADIEATARAAAAVEDLARREHAQAAARERERRLVAAATCPNRCDHGYVGTWVCDHRRVLAVEDSAGYRQARAVVDAAAASAARKAAADRGRHPSAPPGRRWRRPVRPWRPAPAPADAVAS